MANTIKLLRSTTPGNLPSLVSGQIAINEADETLFYNGPSNVRKSFKFQSYLPSSGGTVSGALTVTGAITQTDTTPVNWIKDTAGGATAISNGMAGLALTSASGNTVNKYTPAIKFGNTDSNFTTTNPKFSAYIVGEVTQTYNDDADGGMALVFFASGDNPGVGPHVPTQMLRLTGTSGTFGGNLVVDGATTLGNGTAYIGTNGYFAQNTTDGADNTAVGLGLPTSSRSGHITVYGNEHATYPGDIRLNAGTGGEILLEAAATINNTLTSSNGTVILTAANNYVRTDTADGSDTKALFFSASSSASTARGAFVGVYGNEHATKPGVLGLYAGSTGSVEMLGAVTMNSTLTTANDITIDSIGNAELILDKGASGSISAIYGETAGLTRWRLALGDTAAEAGSSAGSDFTLARYSDAGAFAETVLTINRSNGNATFHKALDVEGKLTTSASSTTRAGLNLPHGSAPTTPVNGDIWTTTAGVYARINGATVGPFGTGGGGGSVAASAVTYSAGGNIVATNVQAAIQELDTEKLAIAGGTITGNLEVDGNSIVDGYLTSYGMITAQQNVGIGTYLEFPNWFMGMQGMVSVWGASDALHLGTPTGNKYVLDLSPLWMNMADGVIITNDNIGTYALATSGATMTGKLNTAASASGAAGLNLPHGTAPTSPVNGDMWTTTAGIYVRVNGATVGPLVSSSHSHSNYVETAGDTMTGELTTTGINLSSSNGLHMTTTTSLLVLSGGSSTTNGGHISMYGGSAVSYANNNYYDAGIHSFRSQAGTLQYMSLASTGMAMSLNTTIISQFSNTGGAGISVQGDCSNASASGAVAFRANFSRAASSLYHFLIGYSGNFADTEVALRGDGNMFADGAWSGGGAGLGEWTEYHKDHVPKDMTEKEARVGMTMVLVDGDYMRPATAQDDPSTIAGVISRMAYSIGNVAELGYKEKYLKDDLGRYIMEEVEVAEWEEEIQEKNDTKPRKVDRSIYTRDLAKNPSVKVPTNAKKSKQMVRKLNPDYDPNQKYVPRSERPEWDILEFTGRLRVLKGQPVNPRWIKMKSISDKVDLYWAL